MGKMQVSLQAEKLRFPAAMAEESRCFTAASEGFVNIGRDGKDGDTPTIGVNGNWFLGSTDTGLPSRGTQGVPGKRETGGKRGTRAKRATGAARGTRASPVPPSSSPSTPTPWRTAPTQARSMCCRTASSMPT